MEVPSDDSGDMGKGSTVGQLRARKELARRQRQASLDVALRRIKEVLLNERRLPETQSLRQVLLGTFSSETIRKYQKVGRGGEPAWTWDYMRARMHEYSPAAAVQWEQLDARAAATGSKGDGTITEPDWSLLDQPFPTTLGNARAEALRVYLKGYDDVISAFPRRMLDWDTDADGRPLGERGTSYCEAAIQLVRIRGRGFDPSRGPFGSWSATEDHLDQLAHWADAASIGTRALTAMAPIVRLSDAMSVARRSALYSDLESDDEMVRDTAWNALDNIRQTQSAMVKEFDELLARRDSDEQAALSEVPVATPMVRRPSDGDTVSIEDPSRGVRSRLPWDANEVILTRYYLLAAETAYAKVRASRVDRLGVPELVRDLFQPVDGEPLPVPLSLPMLSPIVGSALCALQDRAQELRSTARAPDASRRDKQVDSTLTTAMNQLRSATTNPRVFWPFSKPNDPPAWSPEELAAAAGRELARLYLTATEHRGHQLRSSVDGLRRLLEDFVDCCEPHPELLVAPSIWPLTRTSSHYAPSPKAVLDANELKSPDVSDDRLNELTLSLTDSVRARLAAVNENATEAGVNYLDPIGTSTLISLANRWEELAARNSGATEYGTGFQQLRTLRLGPMWPTLPTERRELWEEQIVAEYSLAVADTEWRTMVRHPDRQWFPIPVSHAFAELKVLLDDLTVAFEVGADLPLADKTPTLAIEELRALNARVLKGPDRADRTAPITNPLEQAVANWRHVLLPELSKRGSGYVTWDDDQWEFRTPDGGVVKYELDRNGVMWLIAVLEGSFPIASDEFGMLALDAEKAKRLGSSPTYGLTVARAVDRKTIQAGLVSTVQLKNASPEDVITAVLQIRHQAALLDQVTAERRTAQAEGAN